MGKREGWAKNRHYGEHGCGICSLHFQIRYRATAIDPLRYLPPRAASQNADGELISSQQRGTCKESVRFIMPYASRSGRSSMENESFPSSIRGFDSLRPLQFSSPDQSAIFAVSDFLYYLNSSLQTFRNRRNTSPFCCK